MRARAAYISCIGTTTILVAASLLMLALVSALVTFHGWPDGAVGQTVPSVALQPTPQPVVRLVRDTTGTSYRRVLAAGRALGSRTATVGLVKSVPVRAPLAIGQPIAVSPGYVSAPAPEQSHGAQPGSPRDPSPPQAGLPPQLTQPPGPPTSADVEALVQALVNAVQPPPGRDPLSGLPLTVPGVKLPLAR
ncbi:MAG: hypothetical protein QOF37_1186 [Thermoleophilaceae bacterium]|nr:hypothetical protein [Thermoleophilaceae bacterium]